MSEAYITKVLSDECELVSLRRKNVIYMPRIKNN